MIAAIACVDYNLGIGYKNQLLVSIKEDMKRFKKLTSDEIDPRKNIVIMGRKTWESLPKKPLKNRINWIITQHPIKYQTMEYQDNDVYFITLNDAKRLLSYSNLCPQNIWVIGGGFIYEQLLPFCSHIYLTRVHHAFGNHADTYFPRFIESGDWELITKTAIEYDHVNEMNFHFEVFVRTHKKNKDDNSMNNTIANTTVNAADYHGKDCDVTVANLSTFNATVDPDKLNSIIPPSTTVIPPDHLWPCGEPLKPTNVVPTELEKTIQGALKDVQLSDNEKSELTKMVEKVFDDVERPKHYTDGKIEVIEFIEDKKLGFCLGNVVKYVARAGKKKSGKLDDNEKEIQDLKKAKWYLNRRIHQLEKKLCCP